MPQRFAVLIGVTSYTQPVSPALHAPAEDALRWTKLLLELGVPCDHITLATSPAGSAPAGVKRETADTAGVQRAMTRLFEQLAAAGEGSQGVVFFAGHGAMRADSFGSCFLQDFTLPLLPPAPGELCSGGALHLTQLKAKIPSNATLVAIIDACRTEGLPGEVPRLPVGLQAEWSDGDNLLVTAAHLNGESFERRLQGGWQGQFTWAMMTLLAEWPRGTDGADAYIAGAWPTLTRRATQLIAAISAEGQSQVPGCFGSAAAQSVPIFGPAGGHVLTSPVEALGHEWGADANGVVLDGNSTVIGLFETDANALPTIRFTTTSVPGGAMRFQVNTSKLARLKATSATAWTSIAWSTVSALTMHTTADGKWGLKVSASQLQWFRVDATAPTVLPNDLNLTVVGGTLKNPDNLPSIYRLIDTLG